MFSDDLILNVENVSKKFDLYESPRDRLKELLVSNVRRRLGLATRAYHREFWALQGINFQVRRGETVGIIGRNGAGKSTLLQIITGTLTPSSGTVRTQGRVSALLELGAGFNPEFSGRDNILLNSAILGLTQNETLEQIESVVAFADIGDYIDQPVKTYSSGMHVRLAFSVAIHVRPELLIIDEALAVGDAVFQSKCMTRLRRMMDDGVSLLFVSHDIGAVKSLCKYAVLLEKGQQLSWGDTASVSNEYTRIVHEKKAADSFNYLDGDDQDRKGNKAVEFTAVELVGADGVPRDTFGHGEEMIVKCTVQANRDISMLGCGIHVRDRSGVDICYSDNLLENFPGVSLNRGDYRIIEWSIPIAFVRGRYDLAVVVSIPNSEVSAGDIRSSDFVLADFRPLAAQFKVIGEWDIYGNLRFGSLKAIRFLTSQKSLESKQDGAALYLPSYNVGDICLKLHLACGSHLLDGWVNVDAFSSDRVSRWDLTQPLPFDDGRVSFIFSEHFIEHLPKIRGAAFLCECFRVLRTGGVLRISTPSLEFLLDCYRENRLDEWRELGWLPESASDLVNEGLRAWGHEYLYDFSAMESALRLAGFANVERVCWHRSIHEDLSDLESRPFHSDIIFEATK